MLTREASTGTGEWAGTHGPRPSPPPSSPLNGGCRWSDQSTFPFILGTFGAKVAMMGGFRVFHVSGPIFRERWGDDGYCKWQ
jgi:hypothetical protein